MKKTVLIAAVIAAVLLLWLGSGLLREPAPAPALTVAEQNERAESAREDRPLTRVRVATVTGEPHVRTLEIRGRTESKRNIVVRSRVDGLVASRPVERGDRVEEGALLCQVTVEDRRVALTEAREALSQAEIEFDGLDRLKREGLQSETAIAQASTALAAAKARVARASLDLERLEIRAPFSGFVEDVHLEVGETVNPGDACVTLVDLDPMLVVGRIPERDITSAQTGQVATAVLSTGVTVEGTVTFVGSTSDLSTRTYAVEIEVENGNYSVIDGLSARIQLPIETVIAHRISPALLSLSDDGSLKVRTIDGDNRVQYHEVQVLSDDQTGVWVSGLPSVSRVITVGQEFVIAGEVVEPEADTFDLTEAGGQ